MSRIDAQKTAQLAAVLYGSTPTIQDAVARAIEIQREAAKQCEPFDPQDPTTHGR